MKCEICNKEYKSLKSLGLHLSHTHKDIDKHQYYDNYLRKENEGICPVCGKLTRYKGGLNGYERTCSISCGQLHPETRLKMSKTNLERYGAENPYGSKQIRDKIKQTNLQNIGVANPFQQKYVQEKAIHNSHTIEAEEKRKTTCLQRYGNIYHIASEEVKLKTKQTLLDRYNVMNAYSIPEIHNKAVQHSLNYHDNYNNDSSWEAILYNKLVQLNINFNAHYCLESRYPFQCDFYLPDTDTFIEINGFWTHGGHWFDKNNQDDITKLNLWKEKSNTSSMYKSAINVWTKSDVIKHQYAIDNKLNYVVLWTLDDIHTYINTL